MRPSFRLAEVRRNRSLTQREVADAMGVSGPRVSDVERGNLDTVSVSVLRAYVEALGGRLKVTAEFDDSTLSQVEGIGPRLGARPLGGECVTVTVVEFGADVIPVMEFGHDCALRFVSKANQPS